MKVIENSKIYCLAADLRLQVSGETLNPISTLPSFVKACSRTSWIWWKHQNFLHLALDQPSQVNWKHEPGILAPEWVWWKKKDFNLWNTWEYERKITSGDCTRWFLFNKMRGFPRSIWKLLDRVCTAAKLDALKQLTAAFISVLAASRRFPDGFGILLGTSRSLEKLLSNPASSQAVHGGEEGGYGHVQPCRLEVTTGCRSQEQEFGALLWDTFTLAEMDFKGR